MIDDEDDALPKRGRGRPRNGDTEANAHRRKVEALRLEAERDRVAATWEASKKVRDMASLYAVEVRLATAWAAAKRAEGRVADSMAFTSAAQKWAAAHAKALDQLLLDEVAELRARLDVRERAERAAGS